VSGGPRGARAGGELSPAWVRAPGSSSNLGAGFDCVGLAVDRWMEAAYEPAPGPLEVVRGDGEEAPPGADLLAESFLRGLRERGRTGGGTLEVRSTVPVARGLGSSAAAVVVGTVLAGIACGEELDGDAAFARAADVEGHGDNAAASAYGGLMAVVGGTARPRPVRLELSSDVGFAFAAPSTHLSTRHARGALPSSVPHHAAAAAVARMAALLRGLATADPDLLREGFDDRELHVPWRRGLIPGAEGAFLAAMEAGAWGVTISGAGSGLLAVAAPAVTGDVASAMGRALEINGGAPGALAFPLRPVEEGVAGGAGDRVMFRTCGS